MSILKRIIDHVRVFGVSATAKKATGRVYCSTVGKIKGSSAFYEDDCIHIAYFATGGLGDYIISKAVLEELISNKCVVTIYCEKVEFAHAIFRDVTEDIRDQFDLEFDLHKYDLVIKADHFIYVKWYNKEKLIKCAPELWQRISYILDNWDELYVDIRQQHAREREQFERCRLKGLDRWTEQRMGQAFQIEDHHVSIPLDAKEETRWRRNLGSVKYITINYGAAELIPGKTQLKLWPRNNYEELISLIKANKPDLEVIQLGDSKAQKIKGVDKCIFGESLEYIKYVLKGSKCHIDCEGGLVHLATQLGTKCIVLFGPTPVHMYGYSQNINIVSDVCSNCMGLHDMWAYKCCKGYDEAICMKSITAQRVFNELTKIISV